MIIDLHLETCLAGVELSPPAPSHALIVMNEFDFDCHRVRRNRRHGVLSGACLVIANIPSPQSEDGAHGARRRGIVLRINEDGRRLLEMCRR